MKFDLNKILGIFNGLNEKTRYLIAGGVVLLIILLDVFLLVLPQVGSIGDINQQISTLNTETQQVLTDKQRINQLKKNLDLTRQQWKALSAKVRPIQEVPIILGTISSIANEFGVKIEQLVPEKSKQVALTTSAEGKYYALPVVIKAHCAYHMFGRFLNKLENEDLFFIINDFIIQNDDKDLKMHSFALTIEIILVDQSSASSKSI